MYLLEELWQGNVAPSVRVIKKGSAYQKIQNESIACMERFRKKLSKKGKKSFDQYIDKEMQLVDISEQDAFIRGVRIGAKSMLDILGEYHSQLPQMNEFV